MPRLNALITDLKRLALDLDGAAARTTTGSDAHRARTRDACTIRLIFAAYINEPPATPAETFEDIDQAKLWLTSGRRLLAGYNQSDLDEVYASRAARRAPHDD
jgi:hypothetical protein